MLAVGAKAVENVWRCEMMRRFACLFLLLLMMAVPMLSVADAQYQLYPLQGHEEIISYSDGKLYTQVQIQYPVSKAFLYVSGEGLEEVSLAGDLTAEEDFLFVLQGKFYVWTAGNTKLTALDGSESISIVPDDFLKKHKSAMPFLLNVCEDNMVTFLMEEGESSWMLCNYDLDNGEFKSFKFPGNLCIFQPCKDEKCFVATTQDTGEKELSMLDWNTGELSSIGTLPVAAKSIAYDRTDGTIYYLLEGNLYTFSLAEGSQLIAGSFPLTDQRAFVSESRELITLNAGVEEAVLVIDLKQFEK